MYSSGFHGSFTFIVLLGAIAVGGCFLPDLSDMMDSGGDPTAPEKCSAFIDAMCANRRDNCFPSVGMVDCRATWDKTWNCSTAFAVSETCDECLAFIDGSEDCLADEADLPPFCDNPITWKE